MAEGLAVALGATWDSAPGVWPGGVFAGRGEGLSAGRRRGPGEIARTGSDNGWRRRGVASAVSLGEAVAEADGEGMATGDSEGTGVAARDTEAAGDGVAAGDGDGFGFFFGDDAGEALCRLRGRGVG